MPQLPASPPISSRSTAVPELGLRVDRTPTGRVLTRTTGEAQRWRLRVVWDYTDRDETEALLQWLHTYRTVPIDLTLKGRSYTALIISELPDIDAPARLYSRISVEMIGERASE